MKFNHLVFLIVFPVALVAGLDKTSFRNEQMRYPRVRKAMEEKGALIRSGLQKAGITENEKFEILIMVFKREKELEVWIRKQGTEHYQKFRTFPVCRISGVAGPKRREGDLQIPEGYYSINRFHPSSDYYLSLGINYPNKSDKIRCKGDRPGGDIFIHGDCVTIGCIPIRDEGIKELYLLCVEARTRGADSIPVWSFPFRMDAASGETDSHIAVHRAFWKEISVGYRYFLKEKRLPDISISPTGAYIFREV